MKSILLVLSTADNVIAQHVDGEPPSASDAHALQELFGDEFIAENARSVCRRAAQLDPADRVEFLCRWVLPGPDHPDFRLDGILTQTDPSPLALELEPAIHRSPRGAMVVSPVFDLLDAAAESGKLTDLRDRISETAESDDGLQRRARTALRLLVLLELGETDAANTVLAELHALAGEVQPETLRAQWPETLVVYRGLHRFPDAVPVGDLLTLLYSRQTMTRLSGGIDEWHTQIVSLLGRVRRLEAGGETRFFQETGFLDTELDEWVPVVRARARSRGPGAAHARWEVSGTIEAHHVAGHQEEYLFDRAPLRGNFSVECDIGVSGTTQFFAAGRFFGVKHTLNQIETGTFRGGAELQPVDPPFSRIRDWMRCRAVFDDGTLTVFLNGRRVYDEQLPEHYDPWIGVRSWWRNDGRFRDFRIAGTPQVPDSVVMSASPKLIGWLPYHDDDAGYNGAHWQWRAHVGESVPDSQPVRDERAELRTGEIVGANEPRLAGSFRESLLRYHRPLDQTGSVEYEFFYEPGATLTHPAVDRLAFILRPDGVGVHWITDAIYDRTPAPPDNLIDEPQNRRGPAPIPLNAGAWNHLKLTLQQGIAHIELNGQPVFERAIEPANRRTFGLFHFCDQTEARVRNVVMRGDWRITPTDQRRPLADARVAELDARRDRLPSVFEHDFRNGIPVEHFRLGGQDSQSHVAVTPDGLQVNESSAGSWAHVPLFSRFSLLGDFDVEASFDHFETGDSEGTASAYLLVDVEGPSDAPRRQFRAMRMSSQNQIEHLKAQRVLQYPDGTNRYSDAALPDESRGGRLRLARRGEKVTMLFAQEDSPLFRVFGEFHDAEGAVPIEGLRLIVVADNGGRSRVVWKDLTLRAERLQYVPEDDNTRRLYSVGADGDDLRELFVPPDAFTHLGSPEWSPDRRFITLDVSTGSTTTSHVFVVDVDNREATDLGPGCMPSFSRDGARIVFSLPGQGIMMMDADGANRRVIDPGGWGVQWSPDGKHLAWGDSGNITLRNVATGEQRPLLSGEHATRYDYIYWNLGWSHDSRSIAFKARHGQTGEFELAVADVDSNELQILFSTTGSINADFTFSPDDNQILFAMNTPDQPGPRLFVVNRNEPGLPTLLPGQPGDIRIFDCAWSSEDRITFSGQRIPRPVDWPPAE